MDIWGLLEVKLSNKKYTWANNQENLIMSTIDRIFCTTDLDAMFPLSSTLAFSRVGGDHTPILWDSGVDHFNQKPPYIFEKWWLLREDFPALVSKSWEAPTKSTTAIGIWD